jgi:hypothetical protein
VTLLPGGHPEVLALLDLVGTGPSTHLDLVPERGDLCRHVGRVLPSELRQLNLAAEAFAVEVLWSSELASASGLLGLPRVRATDDQRPMATLVTHGDLPQDQIRAGRALAHVSLRAAALGLGTDVGLHVLSRRETRDELRRVWQMFEHPQVQFTLTDQTG